MIIFNSPSRDLARSSLQLEVIHLVKHPLRNILISFHSDFDYKGKHFELRLKCFLFDVRLKV